MGLQTSDAALAVALARLRSCCSDLGWSHEALAVAMGHAAGYQPYVSRVLNGEKPLTLQFLTTLPDDVLAEFHARSTEDFGRVVVRPAVGDDAVRQFVAGLLGLLARSLPVRAGAPVKAQLRSEDE